MTIPSPAAPVEVATEPRRETKVYAVGALKGGTGKTRLAMLIALILRVVFKRRVLVYDADSGSQTSSSWPLKARARGYVWDLEVRRHPFDTLHEEVDAAVATGDFDIIIIDVGGGNIAAFQSAVRRAHKLLVPLCPDEGDLEQAPKTRDAAMMAATLNPYGCAFYYLLSRCENSRDREDSREILLWDDPANDQQQPYPLLDTDIPMRTAYKRAFGRIPRLKGAPVHDPDQPRWDELTGFLSLLLETEILTVRDVLDASLMTRWDVKKLAPMLIEGEAVTPEELLELGVLDETQLDGVMKELADR